ncbi:hypothetical protein [Mesorhizobium sp.]|uniref:hypothetical protein n=1 Tax=Mesorhizobium sp. TaxID=1871066 RepID=UPI000FE3AD1B|nr:hypothetical protein [Mesorhizobium sp.]RWN55568.1 MAG: hypothetical protein EOR98_12240 [Mesorhizobium sp.]RWN77282.1 MAG: hypothetical protein EOS02_12255 [Mesorhizobium sp.]RWN80179.1 MAG: hypothetical protein EOS01_12305 [Mesorhizobium sp.]RWN86092.1 MAG: hypothetical protein EOS04_19570 [Mesorhizobium sp.]RWO15018.1 MAG: hypothetical protein EOS15_12030 [Mesorhizobium sp.]
MNQRFAADPEAMQHEFYDEHGRKQETFYYGCRRSMSLHMCFVAAWLAINDGNLTKEKKVEAYRAAKLSWAESAWSNNRAQEMLVEMARGDEPVDVMIFRRCVPKKYRADLPHPWIDYRQAKDEAWWAWMSVMNADPWSESWRDKGGAREHKRQSTALYKAWCAIKKPAPGEQSRSDLADVNPKPP